ncbi:hypothetical protein FEP26_03822 [Burkholderia multivorans]|nr:hypothetical protein [Burkholderia multivorans]MDR9057855.1 hypothetical protein [Burkholderia multivorans]MDR9076202.1 hypothetical protein [Burkholderia multivorans]MDR9100417.1 hypothetical protein [Burkholderia multivorans]MDR9146768.1 hypothetical protein [Burkholderia multivorans]
MLAHEIAPRVVLEAHPRIRLQQVAEHFRYLCRQRAFRPHRARPRRRRVARSRRIDDIARRIEREPLLRDRADRLDQPSDRIVPIVDAALAAVLDPRQLTGRVIAIPSLDQRRRRRGPLYRLLQHASGRIVVRALSDLARQHPHRLSMQIVALELHSLVAIQQHPVHVPGAVHQPVDRVAVRSHGAPSIAEFVVFVMPHVAASLAEQIVGVMLSDEVPDRVEEELHATVAVHRVDQAATPIVRKPLLAFARSTLQQPPVHVEVNRRHAAGFVDGNETTAVLVVLITRRLAVEADLFDQPSRRIVVELICCEVRIGQCSEPAETIVAIRNRLPECVCAARNAARRVVAVSRRTVQLIGMPQQSAFGVVLHVLDAGGRTNLRQLPVRSVTISDHAAGRILGLHHAPDIVVLPLRILSGAIGVARELPGVVVFERLGPALRIGDLRRQPLIVVRVLRRVLERIDLLDEIARIVVLALPHVPIRIDEPDHLVLVVVRHLDDAAVGAFVPNEIAACVVFPALDAAILPDMQHQIVIRVATEPLLIAIRIHDPVHIAVNVEVVPRHPTKRIGHVCEADVRIPCEPNVQAAVIRIFTNAFRVRVVFGIRAIPFERHAAARSICIARHKMPVILIRPCIAMAVDRTDEITVRIVFIARQRTALTVLEHLLDLYDPAMPVMLERKHIAARVDQAREAIKRIVVQRDGVPGAIFLHREPERIASAFVYMQNVMAVCDRRPRIVEPRQRQVLRQIVVHRSGRECRVVDAAPLCIAVDPPVVLDVDARRIRRDPACTQLAAVICRQPRAIGTLPDERQRARQIEIHVRERLIAEREIDGSR